MADEPSGQEKTEAPTPRRLLEARQKGDVAKSIEVPSVAILLSGLLTIYFLGNYMLEHFYIMIRYYLENIHSMEITTANIPAITYTSMIYSGKIIWPLLAVLFIMALLSNYLQVGVLFSTEKITPKLEKIDPIKGLGNLFSKQTLANVVKSIFKITVVTWVAYVEIKQAIPDILQLVDQSILAIIVFIAKISFWIFLKSTLIIAILAVADYAFQRWQFMEKMKMTKQEVKDEAKQTEGDPMVKGRIRSIQMEMAKQRMMSEVPAADVVITNPTQLAIALRYDTMTMSSPVVVAKGAGVIARRIKEVAEENKVPIVEDKPLAQALYKSVEISGAIPENLFQAVAEVLAYVFSLKQTR